MAGLPPDGTWLIQQNDGVVSIFNQYTQEQILSYNSNDANETAAAQKKIHDLKELDDEQKCFAHFWAGYFHAHAKA